MIALRAVDQPGEPCLAHEGGVVDRPAWAFLRNMVILPEDVAKLTPEDILMMRKYTELQDRAKQYAKQKREQVDTQQEATQNWRSNRSGEGNELPVTPGRW